MGALARGGRGRGAASSRPRRSTRRFRPAPPGSDGPSAADAAKALLPFVEEFAPDVVVSDILTMAPALAAEMAGCRRAVLIPHVYPVHEPGLPFFAFGAQPPRTPVGRALWRAAEPVLVKGLERGRREMNETRAACGLPPLDESSRRAERGPGAGGDVPAARVSARLAGEHARDRADDVRAGAARTWRCRPGTARWWWWRRRPRRIRSASCCGGRSRGWRTSRCGCSRRPISSTCRSRCPRRRRTRWWSTGSPTRRRCRSPTWSITHGGHGTVCRALGAGRAAAVLPCGRRHGGERRAGAVGGRRPMIPWRLDGAAVDPNGGQADARRSERSAPGREELAPLGGDA